jgi:hypothetical protein
MTPCFLVVPTGIERVALRRYKSEFDKAANKAVKICPAMPGEGGYHNAETPIGEFPDGQFGDEHPHDDPRWPRSCACGYVFQDEDEWQVFKRDLYRRADGQPGTVTLWDRSPGMMWSTPWYHDPVGRKRVCNVADLRARWPRGVKAESHLSSFYWHDHAEKRAPLTVICPNGREWTVDAVSSNGAGWEVRGEPPLITCSPSIAVPGYHGWLGSNGAPPGHFTDDVEGRGPMGVRA